MIREGFTQTDYNKFRCYENLMRRSEQGINETPSCCARCGYYQKDFKYRFCLFAECPFHKKESVFRNRPLQRDRYSKK